MKRLIPLLIIAVFATTASTVELPTNLNFETLESIQILDNGRHKPLATFAGETMKEITGKWNYEGHHPINMLLSMLTTHGWTHENIIKVGHIPLKEQLGLDSSKNYFSYETLVGNQQFQALADRVIQKSNASQDLTPLENHAGEILHKLNLFQAITSNRALKIVPPPAGSHAEADWLTINQMPGAYNTQTSSAVNEDFRAMLTAYTAQNPTAFNSASAELKSQLAGLNPEAYQPASIINWELHYNDLRPFLWSWIMYLIAALLFSITLFFKQMKKLYWTAFGFTLVGFFLNGYGMILRTVISGRAPVSNMYETVVWVAWGIVLTAICFELVYRRKWFITIASVLGVGMLILADILPFDSNIEPLVPVLRSNYWLVIHVLTITLSYSIFALAMGFAHVILFLYFFRPNRKDLLSELSLFLYRTIQVGVVLLAAGTILGGVWAAESWGRFWGWDPKETWALISLLGYLAILHARYTGWMKDFGTAIGAIIGFQLILMTWYGVNFVLATGLHSYGFGTGGGGYVLGYLLLEGLFLAGVAYKYKMQQPSKELTQSSSDSPEPIS